MGQTIIGSTGNPLLAYYGSTSGALIIENGSAATLQHLRFLHQKQALRLASGTGHMVRHLQVSRCQDGISPINSVSIHNALFSGVDKVVAGASTTTINGQYWTASGSGQLKGNPVATIGLLNSLLVQLTTEPAGTFTDLAAPQFSVVITNSSVGVFQAAAGGAHYLPPGSVHRGAAKAGADSILVAQLQHRTTEAPSVVNVLITADPKLRPINTRDATAADLGYHYPAVDYVFQQASLKSTLSIAPGTVVAVAGSSGIRLQENSKVTARGRADSLSILTRYTAVQESSLQGDVGGAVFHINSTYSQRPSIKLAFVRIEAPSQPGGYLTLLDNLSTQPFASLWLEHSQLRNVGMSVWPVDSGSTVDIRFLNNLLERCRININKSYYSAYTPMSVTMRNNLFWWGTFGITYDYNSGGNISSWTFRDNLLDKVTNSLSGANGGTSYVSRSHNGFTAGTGTAFASGTTDKTNLTADYVIGTLGNRYLPINSSTTSLSVLRGVGQQLATLSGLYHFTTTIDQAKELSSQVDIGFHYVALGAGGGPIDTDGDQIADYVEDRDGDNVIDSGETGFTTADSDYDGRRDGEELVDQSSPLNPDDYVGVRLGHWRFNSGAYTGELGEAPKAQMNLALVAGWRPSDNLVNINSASSAYLSYRDVETSGKPNINLRQGTVRFWFRPSWTSSTTDSGTATLLESGDGTPTGGLWQLVLNKTADSQLRNQLRLESVFSSPSSWVSGLQKFEAGKWYQVTVSYSPTRCSLFINGALIGTSPIISPAVYAYPTAASRAAAGFTIGATRTGGQQARGMFEELETFNYPLSSQDIRQGYVEAMLSDEDQDGLGNVREHEIGTSPVSYDHDADGMPDGWEVAQGLNPLTNDAGGDPDNDLFTNVQEYQRHSDPNSPSPSSGVLVGDYATRPEDVVSIDAYSVLSGGGKTISGPALTGFDASDHWNLMTEWEFSGAMYGDGRSLDNATGARSGVWLSAFRGPFFLRISRIPISCRGLLLDDLWMGSLSPTWNVSTFISCLMGTFDTNPAVWNHFNFIQNALFSESHPLWFNERWPEGLCGDWRLFMVRGGRSHSAQYLSNWCGEAPPYWWGNHYRLYRLYRFFSAPHYLPLYDYVDGTATHPGINGNDAMSKMYKDMLLTADYRDPEWWNGWLEGFWSLGDSYHMVISGLEESPYRIYFYGADADGYGQDIVVNTGHLGRTGGRGSGNLHQTTKWVEGVHYAKFTVMPWTSATPPEECPTCGQIPPSAKGVISLDFRGTPAFAGMQIVRLRPLIAPSGVAAVPGQGAVHLSWTQSRTADAYDVFRSSTPSGGFVKIGSTEGAAYSDAGWPVGVPAYYYIIARNEFYESPRSDIVNAAPLAPPKNGAPFLNSIRLVELARQEEAVPYEIPYITLLRSSDASDYEKDPLSFRVTRVLVGTLTIDGQVAPAEPATDAQTVLIKPSSTVTWLPPEGKDGDVWRAFEVKAYDGNLNSERSVAVSLKRTPATQSLGWGAYWNGQLGDGSAIRFFYDGWKNFEKDGVSWIMQGWDRDEWLEFSYRAAPRRVVGMDNARAITHSPDSHYGTGLGIQPDGTLWGWGGGNEWGIFGVDFEAELNEHQNVISYVPVPVRERVNGVASTISGLVDVELGFGHALAIRKDGTLWSWGEGSELGYPTRYPGGGVLGNQGSIPFASLPLLKDGRVTTSPAQIKGLRDVVQAIPSMGGGNLALTADGRVWWWGIISLTRVVQSASPSGNYSVPEYRTLIPDALEATSDPAIPNLVEFPPEAGRIIQIAADGPHFMALAQDGRVWEFGVTPRRVMENVGGGATCGNHCFFTKVPELVQGIGEIRQIACSDSYSLALREDGTVWGWGDFSLSAGWESSVRSVAPSRVPKLQGIRWIGMGTLDPLAFAIDKAGQAYVWGWNDSGLMGTGVEWEVFHEPRLLPELEQSQWIGSFNRMAFARAQLPDGRKPSRLEATGLDGAVRLTWASYPGATHYSVKRSEASGGPYEVVGSVPGNSFLDSGLANGGNYFYVVTAWASEEETAPSAEVWGVPMPAPGMPGWNLPAEEVPILGTCRSITLKWSPPEANLGLPLGQMGRVSEYRIYRSSAGGAYVQVGRTLGAPDAFPGGQPQFRDTSVALGTTYSYRIAAANAAGEGPVSSVVSASAGTCPPAPTEFRATPDNNRIQTQWDHVAGADYYIVKRKMADGRWVEASRISGVEHTLWLEATPNGQRYTLAVVAVIGGDEGDRSNEVVVTPRCPCSPSVPVVRAIAGNGQVYLEWPEDPKAVRYTLKFALDPNSTQWTVVAQDLNDVRYWHTGRANGTTYYYRVEAVNPAAAPTTAESATVSATPQAANQSNLAAFTVVAQPYNGFVHLVWPSGQGNGLLYFVERKLESQSDATYQRISDVDSGLSFIDRDVINATTYRYRVTRLDLFFNRLVVTTSAVTPQASLGTSLVTPVPGNAHVRLSWTWSSGDALQFQVMRSESPGGPYQTQATLRPDELSYTDVGLINGSTYYYRVAALSFYGLTIQSEEASATPLGTLRPLPPTGFAGSSLPESVELNWSPAVGAVSYEVQQNVAPYIPVFTGSVTQARHTGVIAPANTVLSYRLRAISSAGAASEWTTCSVVYTAPLDDITASNADLAIVGLPSNVVTPTNLLLRASARIPTTRKVHFYHGSGTLIGTATAAPFQFAWINPPKGTYGIYAKGVDERGNTVLSGTVGVTVTVKPELSAYTAAETDLTINAPGLPIGIGRDYDSRRSAEAGVLGKGWRLNWESASLSIANPLKSGWQTVPFNSLSGYGIAESSSHLVTLELPGGSAVYFAPVLNTEYQNPLGWTDNVQLKFAPLLPNQGTLRCDQQGPLTVRIASNPDGVDWGTTAQALNLYFGTEEYPVPPEFAPQRFTYTAADGGVYVYELKTGGAATAWRLTYVADRNGNCIWLHYTATSDSAVPLTKLVHSNGRSVELAHTVSGGDRTVLVYDPIELAKGAGKKASVKFIVQAGLLREVHHLNDRTAGTYDITKHEYGTVGNDLDRLTKSFDPRNVQTVLNQYDLDGRLLTQTDALKRSTTFGFNGTTLKLEVTRTVGVVSEKETVDHDARGNIVKTLSAGTVPVEAAFSYNERGLLAQETRKGADGIDRSKIYHYDRNDRPVGVTDELGNTSSTEFDAYNQPVRMTDAEGNGTSFDYDEFGNLRFSLEPGGVETRYEYYRTGDADGIAAIVNGVVKSGFLKRKTIRGPGVPYAVITDYSYDTNGDLKEETLRSDPAGTRVAAKTRYTYDANGNRLTQTVVFANTAKDEVTTSVYDGRGRVTQTVDPAGRASLVGYGPGGRQETATDPLNRVTVMVYDAIGNLIETRFEDGTVTRSVYDQRNRRVWLQDRVVPVAIGGGVTTTTAPATQTVYDQAGRVQFVRRYSGTQVRLETDSTYLRAAGQAAVELNTSVPLGSYGTLESTTRNEYFASGQLKYAVNSLGQVTQHGYDAAGRRNTVTSYPDYTVPIATIETAVISPTGASRITTTGFDGNGNALWTDDPSGRRTSFEYDGQGRQTVIRFPLVAGDAAPKERRTAYDALGRRTSETDEAGVRTRFEYDHRGLLTLVLQDATYDGVHGSPARTEYAYDEAGRMISQVDALGRVTLYEHDKLGRRTKRTLPKGTGELTPYEELVSYTETVDATDVVSPIRKKAQREVTDFRGVKITTLSDISDRPETVTLQDPSNPGNPSANVVRGFTYYPDGRPKSVRESRGNQILRHVWHRYDALGRLVLKGSPEGILTYTHDQAGNVKHIKGFSRALLPDDLDTVPGASVPDASWTHNYDGMNRVKEVVDYSHVWGGVSPRTTGYSYDLNGNLQVVTYPTDTPTTHTYIYTEQNRLKELIHAKGVTELGRYQYVLGRTGNRESMTEPGRRRSEYQYDRRELSPTVGGLKIAPRLYRLTQEKILTWTSGAFVESENITHDYDIVGNRTKVGTYAGSAPYGLEQILFYDHRDRINPSEDPENPGSPAYHDRNGNTVDDPTDVVTPFVDSYDAENRLIARGPPGAPTLTIGYDERGNRVSKRTASTKTLFLVEERNHTGYPQVVAEYLEGEPATTGVQGLWRFDEVTGTTSTDDSGAGRTVTLVGAVQRTAGARLGGLDFNGVSTTASVPNATGLQLGTAFTLSFWVRKDSEPVGETRILGKGTGTTLNYSVSEQAGAGQGLVFRFMDAGGVVRSVTSTTALAVGTWYQVSCTYNGSTLAIYINGTATTAVASGTPRTSTEALHIGSNSGTGEWFDGAIDEVRIYSRVLSSTELGHLRGPGISKSYTHGLDLISQKAPATSTSPSFYGYDGLGSVRRMWDQAGTVTVTYDYDAFGNLMASTGPAGGNLYRFAGEQWDEDLNLYYNRARYYSPQFGRFWTMDSYEGSTGDPASLHKYLYCNANPVSLTDPSGHNWNMASVSTAVAGIATMAGQQLSQIISRTGPALVAGGRQAGLIFQQYGAMAQNTAYSVLRVIQSQIPNLQIEANTPRGSRLIDYTLRLGDRVMDIEVKYKLPSKAGAALTRLVSQVQSSSAAGEAKTVLWTYKEPTMAELRLLQSHLGGLLESGEVQLVYGYQGLVNYVKIFFQ